MMKSYKYRIYPNKEVTQKLEWTLERCRELYNAALTERKEAYRMSKVNIFYNDQSAQLSEIKELRPEYKEIYAQVLQEVLKRVDKTFRNFFRRVKQGEKPGYPRFQGRNRYDSFTYPQMGKTPTGQKGPYFEGKKIVLPKFGHVRIKLHRPVEGKIKTCTVKREGEQWYVVLACEVDRVPQLAYSDEAIGVDLGLKTFATLSNGATIENPRYFRRGAKKLAKAQQSLARRKRGSHRRKKAVQKVTRCHRKVRNQRKDFLHKQSHNLVRCYETIVFEDIQPANLSRAPKPKQDEETGKYLPNGASAKGGLNKSILDAGWGTFIAMCEYKAANAGSQVLRVDPRNTSQICSGCGEKGPHKDLSVRTHTCVHCGLVLDRDHNAALNILALGLRVQAA